MARPVRVEIGDAVYRIAAGGNDRMAIYRDDRDRPRFLETLEEAHQQFALTNHCCCLMPNHNHLLPRHVVRISVRRGVAAGDL